MKFTTILICLILNFSSLGSLESLLQVDRSLINNLISHQLAYSQQRGAVLAKFENSKVVDLYRESHALVIGVSAYRNGWNYLPGVADDVKAVSEVLQEHGFKVETLINPTRTELDEKIRTFIASYGEEERNRLLIYFAGHGHTVTLNDKRRIGYIVPVDAPHPSHGEGPFKAGAISMNQFKVYAEQIVSKHAIFIFDSCFAGTIFRNTNRIISRAIAWRATEPVRQFITAGTDEQQVPDESVFRRMFVRGLRGEADRNKDGFVTGSELGGFLQDTVSEYDTRQNPQIGTLLNPDLNRGDLVFQLPRPSSVSKLLAPVRGKNNITIRDKNGKEENLYDGSYAIVIGMSDYRFWGKLPGVEQDVNDVSKALIEHGFQVEVELNLTRAELDEKIRIFISKHGKALRNRLVIYFAGHGHSITTSDGRSLKYLIPSDAPIPSNNGVLTQYAISSDEIELYAIQIESRHAFFVLDAPLSLSAMRSGIEGGSVRALRTDIKPLGIKEASSQPVRLFLTAGSSEMAVPDKSTFTPYFIRGLKGESDLDGDGFITGQELCIFVTSKVATDSRNAQLPQYGKIRHPNLDRGDILFVVPK